MSATQRTVTPDVAVVISTYNRSEQLPRLLGCLEQQSLPRGGFEVIVVDDGSSDDTPRVLRELSQQTPLELQVIRVSTNGGQARGRNIGWLAARSPIIAFTDDDCQPQPQWLEELVTALELTGVSIAQGRTTPDPDQWPPGSSFDHWLDIDGPSAWFETCNIAYRRTVLEQLGGFDETYTRFCEDTDLGLRALDLGAEVVHVPDAHVLHDVRPQTWLQAARATRRHAEIVRLVKEHPEIRAQFTHWFAYDKAQLSATAVAASTFAALFRPRNPLPWLSLAWWLRRYLRQRHAYITGPAPERLRLLGGWLAVDLAETAHLLRESARQRTFLM